MISPPGEAQACVGAFVDSASVDPPFDESSFVRGRWNLRRNTCASVIPRVSSRGSSGSTHWRPSASARRFCRSRRIATSGDSVRRRGTNRASSARSRLSATLIVGSHPLTGCCQPMTRGCLRTRLQRGMRQSNSAESRSRLCQSNKGNTAGPNTQATSASGAPSGLYLSARLPASEVVSRSSTCLSELALSLLVGLARAPFQL